MRHCHHTLDSNIMNSQIKTTNADTTNELNKHHLIRCQCLSSDFANSGLMDLFTTSVPDTAAIKLFI